MTMKTLIVIPTYNEADNVERLLGRLMNVDPGIEVLVVDDNSPDGTGDLVGSFARKNPRIHLLRRPGKQGLGPAYLAGFQWGLARDYDLFMEMDADLSHRPRYLPVFFEKIKNCDIVVGSRWMRGGKIVNWPVYRVLLSQMASLYSKIILGVSVNDMTAGYICYRRKVLETIDLDNIHSDGYCFQIEMKFTAWKLGFKIVEVPIIFTDRTEGTSKMSKGIIKEAVFGVLQLKLRSWFCKF